MKLVNCGSSNSLVLKAYKILFSKSTTTTTTGGESDNDTVHSSGGGGGGAGGYHHHQHANTTPTTPSRSSRFRSGVGSGSAATTIGAVDPRQRRTIHNDEEDEIDLFESNSSSSSRPPVTASARRSLPPQPLSMPSQSSVASSLHQQIHRRGQGGGYSPYDNSRRSQGMFFFLYFF